MQGNGRKKKKIIIAILLLLLSVSAGTFAYFGLTNQIQPSDSRPTVTLDENGSAVNGEVQGKSKEQILSELQKTQVTVTDKVSSSAIFRNGTAGSIGSWNVENLPSNNVIMQCEIYEGDRLLVKSVPIYPNQHIERIELLESIQCGSHDVVAYINYFKLDTKEFISKAGYKINLVIRN